MSETFRPGETTVRRSNAARSAIRNKSSIYGLRRGQEVEVTDSPLAGGGIMSSPPIIPEMRVHCDDSQAEQNTASFPASANPLQCGVLDGSAATSRNCGACSELRGRLRSASSIQRLEPISHNLLRCRCCKSSPGSLDPVCSVSWVDGSAATTHGCGPWSVSRSSFRPAWKVIAFQELSKKFHPLGPMVADYSAPLQPRPSCL